MTAPDARSEAVYIIPRGIMVAYPTLRKAAAFPNRELGKPNVITVILSATNAVCKWKALQHNEFSEQPH